MNYEQASSVKELAPEVYDVLKRLNVECLDTTFVNHRGCLTCDGTSEIKWKWQPQVGEWCVGKNYIKKLPLLITSVGHSNSATWMQVNCQYWKDELSSSFIPILEWEEIEGVLEKTGYEIWITKINNYFKCRIFRGKNQLILEQQETRLLAVYKAAMELGKEL